MVQSSLQRKAENRPDNKQLTTYKYVFIWNSLMETVKYNLVDSFQFILKCVQ